MSSTKSENGYYYNINTGVFEGTISTSTGDKNRVFACTGLTKDNRFINPQKIELTHEEFQICATIIAEESGTATEECIYFAFTTSNWAKRKKTTLYKLLMTGYSSVPKAKKVAMPDTANTPKGVLARKGLLQAQLGYPDPTGGATHWDGTDFLAQGLKAPDGKPQNKFVEYKKITIPKTLYQYYLNETLKANPSKRISYKGKPYSIPAEVFLDKKNWATGDFIYETGAKSTQSITATVAAGLTIFWRVS